MSYVACITLCQNSTLEMLKKTKLVTYTMSLMWRHQLFIEKTRHWHEDISNSWLEDMSQIWFLSVTLDSKTRLRYDSYFSFMRVSNTTIISDAFSSNLTNILSSPTYILKWTCNKNKSETCYKSHVCNNIGHNTQVHSTRQSYQHCKRFTTQAVLVHIYMQMRLWYLFKIHHIIGLILFDPYYQRVI